MVIVMAGFWWWWLLLDFDGHGDGDGCGLILDLDMNLYSWTFLNTYRFLQSQNKGLPKSAKLLSLQLQARLQRNICMLVNQSLIQINQNRKLCIWKRKYQHYGQRFSIETKKSRIWVIYWKYLKNKSWSLMKILHFNIITSVALPRSYSKTKYKMPR